MSVVVNPSTPETSPAPGIVTKTVGRIKRSIENVASGDGLKAKVFRGGAWLGAGSATEQVSRFARNMLLTRLLAPGAFGTMAVVLSCASVIGTLTDVGTRQAVIQNSRGSEEKYLNAGWWMAMGRALCVYASVFIAAPWISHFYGNVELAPLLRVALLSTLFEGAMSPRSALPIREMNFRRWAAISNGGGICGVVLTVILTFFLRDVWALAIGFCAENALRCLLSYILCPGLPSLGWDRDAIRDLLKFSRGVVGLSFLNLIFIRADIFVLAKMYSPAALGLYTMAVYLVQTPASFLANLLTQTFLPACSKVQEDKERLKGILVKLTSWLMLLGLPAVVVVGLSGSSLLTLAYGPRYAGAALSLAVAAAVAFLNTLNLPITIVFYGMGQPALHRRAVAATAITMVIAIYPACRYFGLVGGQLAALLAIAVGYLLQLARIRSLTELNLGRYGRALVWASAMAASALGVYGGGRLLGLAARPIHSVALGLGACLIGYTLCLPALMRLRQSA